MNNTQSLWVNVDSLNFDYVGVRKRDAVKNIILCQDLLTSPLKKATGNNIIYAGQLQVGRQCI